MEQKEPGFHWDYAVTSKTDKVFPSENVIKYWKTKKRTKQIIVPYPHYMFYKWDSYADFINFVEKYYGYGKPLLEMQESAKGLQVFEENI